MKYIFLYSRYFFCKSYSLTNWMLCAHFQISTLSNHHGLGITPELWIIHALSLLACPFPFISMNNQEYTAYHFPPCSSVSAAFSIKLWSAIKTATARATENYLSQVCTTPFHQVQCGSYVHFLLYEIRMLQATLLLPPRVQDLCQ